MIRTSPVTRVDYALAAMAGLITLLIAGFMAPRGFQQGFVDMAHDGYQLRQVVDLSAGLVLFRDTFDQYGILSAYVNALGFQLFGGSLLGLKYFLCLIYGATAFITYLIARELTGRVLAVVAVVAWLAIAPFYQHGIMISAHAHILLMQAVALLLMLRVINGRARPLPVAIVVGVLTALMWAAKATSGVLFAAAVIACIGGYGWRMARSREWTTRTSVAFVVPAVGVVAVLLGLLGMAGAFADWRLQTMEFPRRFYLEYFLEGTGSTGTLGGSLTTFMWRNLEAEFIWAALRGVVIGGGLLAAVRLPARDAAPFVLMGIYTLLAWGGTFPSANFMHQWWTASLAVPAFAAVAAWAGRSLALGPGLAQTAAGLAVVLVVAQPARDRVHAAIERQETLTATITTPPVLAGLRTTPVTKASLETLYRTIADYRQRVPGARVLSIDGADGATSGSGVPAGLLLINFFPDSRIDFPVYWSLPVLSDLVYPAYFPKLAAVLARQQSVVVDHTNTGQPARLLPGYGLAASAPSGDGEWRVYLPVETDEDARRLAERLLPVLRAGPSRLTPPAELSGHIIHRRPDAGNTKVPLAVSQASEALVAADLKYQAQAFSQDGSDYVVRGTIATPFEYLAWTNTTFRPAGSLLVVRGEVLEGGLTVGLIHNDQWAGTVNIEHPQKFLAVLEVPGAGEYSVVIANNGARAWEQARARSGWRGLAAVLLGRETYVSLWPATPSHARLQEADWVTP